MKGPTVLTPSEGNKIRRNSLWLWTVFQFCSSFQRAALKSSLIPGTLSQKIQILGLMTLRKKPLMQYSGTIKHMTTNIKNREASKTNLDKFSCFSYLHGWLFMSLKKNKQNKTNKQNTTTTTKNQKPIS